MKKDDAIVQQSEAWFAVWDLCKSMGMDTSDPDRCGKDDVLDFITSLYERASEEDEYGDD